MYYSPLRYPGGKAKLAPFMEIMIRKMGHCGGTYVEPFAGGAGVALELLEKGVVKDIVINDYDKGIYSFWKAILSDTSRFVQDVYDVPLTIEEWKRQQHISLNCLSKYSYELGFSTFYLNRTNRSGIIKGGVIGGENQEGYWKMNARFNKTDLINRIEAVARRRNQIHLYNKDIVSFIDKILPKYEYNSLIYFDPPYYKKGKQLYLNYFEHNDHLRIRDTIIEKVKSDWIITYDDIPEIVDMYDNYPKRRFDLEYSASRRRTASEIMVFKSKNMVPDILELDRRSHLNMRAV